MPGEVIDHPNPAPLPSHLPECLEKLEVRLPSETLNQEACDALLKFRKAASYIAAGKSNYRDPFSFSFSFSFSFLFLFFSFVFSKKKNFQNN
jgi:xylulose-5-phosphate/fructose-6-phosphate phosphoketolase